MALRSSAVSLLLLQDSSVSSELLLRSSEVSSFTLQVRYLSELPLGSSHRSVSWFPEQLSFSTLEFSSRLSVFSSWPLQLRSFTYFRYLMPLILVMGSRLPSTSLMLSSLTLSTSICRAIVSVRTELPTILSTYSRNTGSGKVSSLISVLLAALAVNGSRLNTMTRHRTMLRMRFFICFRLLSLEYVGVGFCIRTSRCVRGRRRRKSCSNRLSCLTRSCARFCGAPWSCG